MKVFFEYVFGILLISLVAFHLFGWSMRIIDINWCTESVIHLVPNDTGSGNHCDPPSKLSYDEAGKHYICKCP